MPTSNSRIFNLRVLYGKQPMQLIKNYTKKSKMPLGFFANISFNVVSLIPPT